MTTLIVERFAQPSRRCDPQTLVPVPAAVDVHTLPHPRTDPAAYLRSIPRALAGWVGGPLTMRERRALLRACWASGGARWGAMRDGPALARRARAGDIDAVACYSTKDFPLAPALAALAHVRCDAMLDHATQYFGEFAFELLSVVPYAYWLHGRGELVATAACADTRALYYFSPRHEERDIPRRYVPITEYPSGEAGRRHYDRFAFPRHLDTRQWAPPPYATVYADPRFRWALPTCVICNKHSEEHYRSHREPTNFIDVETLLAVIRRLHGRYQVVYNRPRAADIVNDHQAIHETGDIQAVKAEFPDVLTIQELHARYPELTFNELQLRVFAGSRAFVSVLGGSSYLASYFGGRNVVYAKRGWEVDCDAYAGWFDRFSGARVVAVSTRPALLDAIAREFG
ncbi:MAG: hypothetical protein JSR18_13400 [Proteobacteria bacterium]|nr:hypothetical protein [Pseudomonadota bacterium]